MLLREDAAIDTTPVRVAGKCVYESSLNFVRTF